MGILKNFLIGAIFIVVGYLLRYHTPRFSDKLLGYKSPLFMNNEDAWYEANRFFGKILLIGGVISTPFILFTNLFYKNNIDLTSILSFKLYLVIAVVGIICTEFHLLRLFNKCR